MKTVTAIVLLAILAVVLFLIISAAVRKWWGKREIETDVWRPIARYHSDETVFFITKKGEQAVRVGRCKPNDDDAHYQLETEAMIMAQERNGQQRRLKKFNG